MSEPTDAAARLRETLLGLALVFHKDVEGEYGCQGETCPGVKRLVVALRGLIGVGKAEWLASAAAERESATPAERHITPRCSGAGQAAVKLENSRDTWTCSVCGVWTIPYPNGTVRRHNYYSGVAPPAVPASGPQEPHGDDAAIMAESAFWAEKEPIGAATKTCIDFARFILRHAGRRPTP